METFEPFGEISILFNLNSGRSVRVPMRFLCFKEWAHKNRRGDPINRAGGRIDRFWTKKILDFRGKPVFAELAVLRILERKGWNGVWVNSFHSRFHNQMLDKPACDLPEKQQKLFNKIKAAKGSRGGCWDVFAWKGRKVLFVETKRRKHDRITKSQIAWLEAALRIGVPLKSFWVVEWDA